MWCACYGKSHLDLPITLPLSPSSPGHGPKRVARIVHTVSSQCRTFYSRRFGEDYSYDLVPRLWTEPPRISRSGFFSCLLPFPHPPSLPSPPRPLFLLSLFPVPVLAHDLTSLTSPLFPFSLLPFSHFLPCRTPWPSFTFSCRCLMCVALLSIFHYLFAMRCDAMRCDAMRCDATPSNAVIYGAISTGILDDDTLARYGVLVSLWTSAMLALAWDRVALDGFDCLMVVVVACVHEGTSRVQDVHAAGGTGDQGLPHVLGTT